MPPASDGQSGQRRGAFRLRVAIRPRIARAVFGGIGRGRLRLGITEISAGGVQVRSQDELRMDDLLELAFDLEAEVDVQARVRRVTRRERAWDAACEFEGVSERTSERIVQFIFGQQRVMLRAHRGRR
jgi:c-di-GMP-binding flagellar brake protein YcgR